MDLDTLPLKTDDQRRRVWLHYIRVIADMYGLKDWVLEMGNDEPTNGGLASVYLPLGRKLGYMRVSQAFITSCPSDQRWAILHELTHCHNSLQYLFGINNLDEVHKENYKVLMEYGIDSISQAISQFYPLPIGDYEPCKLASGV